MTYNHLLLDLLNIVLVDPCPNLVIPESAYIIVGQFIKDWSKFKTVKQTAVEVTNHHTAYKAKQNSL